MTAATSGQRVLLAQPATHAMRAAASARSRATASIRSRQREQELSVQHEQELYAQREGGVWYVSSVTAAANSASEMAGNCEQWLPFVVMAAGERKRWI